MKSRWTENEINFLKGVIEQHGNPNKWSEETKAMVKQTLASRTESGIYQRSLAILKARKTQSVSTTTFQMVKGNI